jgi:hypothetical protein
MEVQQRAQLEREVERTILSFFRYLDTRQYEKLVSLIAPDGVWNRQGKALKGPEQAMAAMRERGEGVTTLHQITNLLVDIEGPAQASATFYMTGWRHDGDKAPGGPVPVQVPFSAAIYREKLVRTEAGWRVKDITGKVVFKR